MATPPSGVRHCRPDCRPCEAVERLGALAAVLDENDAPGMAQAVYDIAGLAGDKSPLGEAIAAAVLDDTPGRTQP